jgi:hypothetical protein
MIFYDMLFFFWPSLGLCRSLLRSIVALLYRFEDSSCYDDTQDADFGLSFFFVVFPFFKCNAIAYALHLRGGGEGC